MSCQCAWVNRAQSVKTHHEHRPFDPTKPYGVMETILEKVGNTPLVRLDRLAKAEGLKCELLAKCEFFNAGGSVKDRIGVRMVEDAEKSGRIKPGDTLIEPTSGNTGIGLALAAAVKGYNMIITLPEKMSQEKVDVLKALGAKIIRTPTEAAFDSPESHIGVALKLNKELPNSHILDQYVNPGNPLAHYDGTAEEILYQCDGKLDYVVVAAGTGGTISGIARKLKERLPNVKVIGVDPHGSILAQPESLNTSTSSYLVEGIGYDFIPQVLERELVDQWYKSEDKESFVYARRLIREEGLLCGGSSGSAIAAALKLARTLKEGDRVVVILPDSSRNYMTKFLSDDWMIDNGFADEALLDSRKKEVEKWHGATIADLKLPTAVSILPTTACVDAVAMMNKRGFDQLPVVKEDGAMVGLVTEGQLLSKISRRLILPTDAVSKAMLRFSRKKRFEPITAETKLADLSRFFEKNSVAFVTEGNHIVKSVVTKIDLLQYLMKTGSQ